jgi:hypothetical protein
LRSTDTARRGQALLFGIALHQKTITPCGQFSKVHSFPPRQAFSIAWASLLVARIGSRPLSSRTARGFGGCPASVGPPIMRASFASNGYGPLSPGKYGIVSCFFIVVIATFFWST